MQKHILDTTRIVEEVPGVTEYRYYLWSGPERKTVFYGQNVAECEDYAEHHGLTVEEFEAFEP
jgi:hypothetical protein